MNLDKYFQSLFDRTGSKQDVVDAGWIENKPIRVNPHVRFYTTPVDMVRNAGKKDVSVLFYPGCFAPVHEGHINAMRLAKEAVETQTGETVAAGFFVPDHDNYIMRKTHDERYIAPNRIALLQEALKDEPWMQVDTWASLYADTDLNFTTLYDRLDVYMKRWVPDVNVKIYMVFGGDNYLFANSFTEYGHGVCVPREGKTMDMTLIHPDALNRVVFSTKISTNHSSTAVRAANTGPVDIHKTETAGTKYVLREDLDIAFSHNATTYPNHVIAEALHILLAAHIPYQTVKIVRVPVAEQLTTHEDNENTLSLDYFWKGEQNLAVSRLFHPASAQKMTVRHINRPNTPDLDIQIAAIPKKEYTLLDDDEATGGTMTFITELLHQNDITITNKTTLLEELDGDLYDAVDMRDFILGAKSGGLVVEAANGKITRMPYLSPYVNLVTRAKINPDRVLSLSVELWKLNAAIYRNTETTLNDIKEHQDFTLFGFAGDMKVADLCEKHLALLTRN